MSIFKHKEHDIFANLRQSLTRYSFYVYFLLFCIAKQKGTRFFFLNTLQSEEATVTCAENNLNFRPRKCLDYLTPHEVLLGKMLHWQFELSLLPVQLPALFGSSVLRKKNRVPFYLTVAT